MTRFRRRMTYAAAILAGIGYLATVGNALFAKGTDARARTMLTLVRERLAGLGVANPNEVIGLEFGPYAGCRVWLLEHLFVDGCLGFRMGEEIRNQVDPERMRQIVQNICSPAAQVCSYRSSFVMSVRYFRVARTYRSSSSTTVIREQAGSRNRYLIRGSEQ